MSHSINVNSGERDEFVSARRELRWGSAKTCEMGLWQTERFLDGLYRGVGALSAVWLDDIDSYFRWMGSITVTSLRKWLEYGSAAGCVPARPLEGEHDGFGTA